MTHTTTTQQWHAAINGEIVNERTKMTVRITGTGDYDDLIYVADQLRQLGFKGQQTLVPIEGTKGAGG